MTIWIIIILSVIISAFNAGFLYARRIERSEDLPLSGKRHLYCLGDGLTYGVGVLSHRREYAWPYCLNVPLGAGWQVLNFGLCDATVSDVQNRGYTHSGLYQKLLEAGADRILFMLGTNDSKLGIWKEERFTAELTDMLRTLQETGQPLTVLLPFYIHSLSNGQQLEVRPQILSDIIRITRDVCTTLSVPTIDLYTFTQSHPEWFTDGVHLNRTGNQAVADYLYTSLAPDLTELS